MDRLRPRVRKELSGFTKNEVEKMESLLSSGDQLLKREFYQKLASSFNRSTGRAGKSAVKWIQIQNWYRDRLEVWPSKVTSPYDASKILSVYPGVCTPTKEHDSAQISQSGVKCSDLSTLEFEARSSKDGAWFDVDIFLAHRFLSSGEPEVCVRFAGFGAEEDEWVNVRTAVRVRSVPFENSECDKIKVGDLVLCLQERKDLAMYYDAHVTNIHRRVHDIRGCRCLFFIRYNHDNTEERVRLSRLCRRPMYYG